MSDEEEHVVKSDYSDTPDVRGDSGGGKSQEGAVADSGDSDDEQPEEHMPGCNRCRFSPAGCNTCRARPFESRPIARWTPEDARFQEGIPSAPVFYPTPEEFADPLSYINKIRSEGEKYGICRIVPPAAVWDPPFMLSGSDGGAAGRGGGVGRDGNREWFRFATRKQFTSHLVMRACDADMYRDSDSEDRGGGGGEEVVQQVAGGGRMGRTSGGRMMGGRPAAAAAGKDPQPQRKRDSSETAGAGAISPGLPGPCGRCRSPCQGACGGGAHADGAKAAALGGKARPAAEPSASGGKKRSGGGGMGRMGSVAAERGAGDGDGSDSGTDSEAFGFTETDRTHTLTSFEAYCRWARSVHFGQAPFSNRTKHKEALERIRARYADPSCKARGGASAAGSLPSPALPPRVQAAVVRAAAGCAPTLDEVEAEFWRIAERPVGDDAVETLYGSDLDSGRHGSGFPLPPWRAPPTEQRPRSTGQLGDWAKYYACHPWNINNLPRSVGSVLRYVQTDELITGVMVPWLYVGSCLSAFCWHVEDHALYSINYLHKGAHKVWYGVPSRAAEQFEAAMWDAVPHLMNEDPRLLHRLVTHMSPTELRRRGVPVCKLVHEAGSFVITFPNAYHAGFNCGFNVAEAVNFAPVDWLPFGSDVIAKYRGQAKRNTISHDGLLIRLVRAARSVRAAHQTAMSLHLVRPSVTGAGNTSVMVKQEPGVKQEVGAGAANGPVCRPAPTKVDAAAYKAAAAEYDAVAAKAVVGGDGLPPYSWQAGVQLSEAPPAAVAVAAGELTVRLEDETRRRAIATGFGVTQERAMSGLTCAKDKDGVHTCTADVDCIECKCDLYLSAVVSPQRPGSAACPEHAAALGVPGGACVMLVRHSLEELREMLDTALELFPEGHAAVAAARQRQATKPLHAIRRLGPISIYGVPHAKPITQQDIEEGMLDVVCAVAGPPSKQPYLPYDPDAMDPRAAKRRDGSGKAASEQEAAVAEAPLPGDAAPKVGVAAAPSVTPAASAAPRATVAALPAGLGTVNPRSSPFAAAVVAAPLPGGAPPPPPALGAARSLPADLAVGLLGAKRSLDSVGSAQDADRTVRPRRERRVPKHLLDEMGLPSEMKHVIAGTAAAGEHSDRRRSSIGPPEPAALLGLQPAQQSQPAPAACSSAVGAAVVHSVQVQGVPAPQQPPQ
ncbi:hypothetical protein GPECTOR_1g593 [Gonium pectorale]|uniref:JmjC domain-containing protein n=1 Tax=Gonium pectorale TaxID=33097 RepID=A0A150H4A5_GONPE|nr:hypothetical protein GPECTOR_1g593 [Gonium pectorale]|eukprot:KXZ56658.1 hypothetical protein GPECTOR_1g593 [Gonium pectorale]